MSGAVGRSERVVHQDYIVRQRYSNALPPPPGAPKLLDIPLNGMATYTMPVYTERMYKAQPFNIEADAFLGMPIDLVGMPGIFEGDESSIQAPLVTPSLDAKDRSLLRPLKSLGKPKNEIADVSFLRRTQYVAEDRSRVEGSGGRGPTGQVKRRKIDATKEDPMYILRSVIKSFDIANPQSAYTGPDSTTQIRGLTVNQEDTKAWKNPKHPTKPHLKMVDSYPLIPDLTGFTEDEQGGYAVLKFVGNPTEMTNKLDPRLEASVLRSLDVDPLVVEEFQLRTSQHKADPEHVKAPSLPTVNYELFLPPNEEQARGIKRKRDVLNPERDDAGLYTDIHDPEGTVNDCFKLNNVRAYESGRQETFSEWPYKEVAIALHDPEPGSVPEAEMEGDGDGDGQSRRGEGRKLQKAAYFYPIVAKTQLKPRRAAQLAHMMGLPGAAAAARAEGVEEKIDVLALQYREQNEEEREARTQILTSLAGS